MRKQKKLVSVSAIFMAFIAATVFLPGLVQAFFFPPAPEYQIETIIHEVEDFVGKGVLSEVQGSALNTIVGEAQKIILDKENTTTACNLLQDFINQVQAYINAGTLAATKGQFLIGSANELISQLR
jgi:hypothetical protein